MVGLGGAHPTQHCQHSSHQAPRGLSSFVRFVSCVSFRRAFAAISRKCAKCLPFRVPRSVLRLEAKLGRRDQGRAQKTSFYGGGLPRYPQPTGWLTLPGSCPPPGKRTVPWLCREGGDGFLQLLESSPWKCFTRLHLFSLTLL